MFAIRKQQMTALAKVEARTVGGRILGHIRKTFPDKFAELGEEKIWEIVQYAEKRVTKYGFKEQADVTKYIEVMVLFGRDFDSDPELPWARTLLRKRKKPPEKIGALHKEAIERWESAQSAAGGPPTKAMTKPKAT